MKDEEKISQRDEDLLEMNKLSPEEVKARNAKLAKMRSLLFYQELKFKRMKKIKVFCSFVRGGVLVFLGVCVCVLWFFIGLWVGCVVAAIWWKSWVYCNRSVLLV